MEAIVESMRDGLILENLDGEIIYANRQAAVFVNLSPVALQQQKTVDILNTFGVEELLIRNDLCYDFCRFNFQCE